MYRYNSAKKPRTRITYGRGKLSAFKSSDTEEEKKNYMHTYTSIPRHFARRPRLTRSEPPTRRGRKKRGAGDGKKREREKAEERFQI